MPPTHIPQRIIPNASESIPVRYFSRRLAGSAATSLRRDPEEKVCIGLATKRSATGRIAILALATVQGIVAITVDAPGKSADMLLYDQPFQQLLLRDDEGCTLAGFDMARVALRIGGDLRIPVCAVDLSTAFVADSRRPSRPSQVVAERVYQAVDRAAVDSLWDNDNDASDREVCLRAWLAACVAEHSAAALSKVVRLDTRRLQPREIACLAELVRQTCVLEDAQPTETPSEFTRSTVTHDGTLELQNARYKTRVRNTRQTIVMTNDDGDEFVGEARGAKGRTTNIRFTGQALSGTLQAVRVVGRPELTNPEKAREELLLLLLQGKASLHAPFIRKLWFPSRSARLALDDHGSPCMHMPGLNRSQKEVASRMVSEAALVITHGPPGTGKTTTIAAAAAYWDERDLPAWIIAHSNVAVKNIAETLCKKGVDFKILVAGEFHFEWHEHIYEAIQQKVLLSDDLLTLKDVGATERLLGGSCIMLSTLSMLSNPTMDKVGVFRVVPLERLVVDEASQIKIEDFMPVFHKFRKTLEKVCFFGDPNQLPPYGKDEVPELKTIFDVEHAKESAGFLDTQYRMPVPLGDFISRCVYGGRLKSEHSVKDASCVAFVDASNGEETKSGFSWTNAGEIQTMVNLVKTYYKNENFCVITPYDAQRAAIERQLKAGKLPWEHVFNVDSFQGNEADFVLVSVVRSGHQPGFLASTNRMNVLLTRCRRGLVVVSSRSFLRDGGRNTLLGRLERHYMDLKGESAWVDWKLVMQGKADLPSALGPKREKSLGTVLPRVHGAPPYYSPLSAGPTKAFDTRSLFPPQLPKVETRASLLAVNAASAWASHTSHALDPSPTSPGTPTSPGPLTPTDYEADFPGLPMAGSPHKQAAIARTWAPHSLLLKGEDILGDGGEIARASASTRAQNRMSGGRSESESTRGTHSTYAHGQPVVRRLEISQQQIARAHPTLGTTVRDADANADAHLQPTPRAKVLSVSLAGSKQSYAPRFQARTKGPATSRRHFTHPAAEEARNQKANGMLAIQAARADKKSSANRYM
ncbi:putative nuclear-transcribed mRNA catabolic process, nonsense-mediated decay [Lyophyllum shimeji]|uniref:Nuclear-transcribed mRNA catabolic process, nonsense-mediated decay n=1 Tax=Lyophyllum shimeji TaxID=47721 RepID=A0A9P3Q018_LYOSH|nr:putative nuclear-transcribed mRNA catabolic process, nonsense-mediated decay [Lyophyllum shimeji]